MGRDPFGISKEGEVHAISYQVKSQSNLPLLEFIRLSPNLSNHDVIRRVIP
jgi:hypothetical protein